MPELERRIKLLERENADLREQRSIPKKAVAGSSEPPALKMVTIQQRGAHPVRKLCRVFGVARSACYAAQKKAARPLARENARPGTKMRELFEASGHTYGSPRLTVALRHVGERCGRHRVARAFERALALQRPPPGCFTIRTAAASMRVMPAANCCAPTA